MSVRKPLGTQEVSHHGGSREYANGHGKYLRRWLGKVAVEVRALGIQGSYLEVGAGPGFLAAMLAEAAPIVRSSFPYVTMKALARKPRRPRV